MEDSERTSFIVRTDSIQYGGGEKSDVEAFFEVCPSVSVTNKAADISLLNIHFIIGRLGICKASYIFIKEMFSEMFRLQYSIQHYLKYINYSSNYTGNYKYRALSGMT